MVSLRSLRQHLIEVVLAEDGAQRRLRELAGRHLELLDLDHRLLRIDHPIVDDGVDLDRDVVLGDHILRRHVEHAGAQVHAHHLLDEGYDDDEAGPLHLPEPAQQEHHAALVLAQDADRVGEDGDDNQERQCAREQ